MPKITQIEIKSTGQIKHSITLPKELIKKYVYQKGDRMILKSMVGNEITFTYERE